MTIHTSVIPAAIDALIVKIQSLNLNYTNEEGNTEPIVVFDGYPGNYQPGTVVAVGGSTEPTDDGEQRWASLGQGPPGSAPAKDEEFELNCYISSFVGGGVEEASYTSPGQVYKDQNDAQKQARDTAFGILASIEVALRNDAQLYNGTSTPTFGTGWCDVRKIRFTQTDFQNAGQGRIAQIDFTVHVFCRLYSV